MLDRTHGARPAAPGTSHVNAVTSRQNPIVHQCRDLARHRPAGGDEVLLDGVHLIGEALDAGVAVATALLSARVLDSDEGAALFRRLERAGTAVYRASDAVMDAASPVRTPSGAVAVGRVVSRPPEAAWTPAPALVACVAGVQDPGNVGAILRAAEAAGASGAIVADGSADPLGWKALRGSMGSALRLPLVTGLGVGAACAEARRRGVRVAATVPADGSDLYDTDMRGPLLLLIGGEGAGLPDEALGAADVRIRIPMRAPVESLNAAVAAGVVLFEARRQRREAART
jgi:RNA methyltransferase, TrmH family